MKCKEALKVIAKIVTFDLPKSYIEFLLKYDGFQNYSHKKYEGKYWRFATLIKEKGSYELNESFKKQYLQIVDTIYEHKYIKSKSAYLSLKNGFPIAYENGDYLFLDTKTLQIKVLWHESGEVTYLSESFKKFLESSEEEFVLPPDNLFEVPKDFQYTEELLGKWENIIDLGSIKLVTIMKIDPNGIVNKQMMGVL